MRLWLQQALAVRLKMLGILLLMEKSASLMCWRHFSRVVRAKKASCHMAPRDNHFMLCDEMMRQIFAIRRLAIEKPHKGNCTLAHHFVQSKL